jgi:DDE superfamily endonuclease
LVHLLRRDPHTCGVNRSRWRRDDVLAHCPWLRLRTPQSLGRLLHRVGITYKRGRDYLHSPDPDYAAKRAAIAAAYQAAQAHPDQHILLYLDEMLLFRQPTPARAWEARGRRQPLARRSQRSDTPTRLLGALDAVTGRLHRRRPDKVTLPTLLSFFQALVAAYPGRTLTVVLDNWPVHFHADLLVALRPQTSPFPRYLPASWSPQPSAKAIQQWGHLQLPLQLLPLPTYASWCNPIEKVWHKLRQELGHLHPWADDLPRLRAEIDHWLDQYHRSAPDLLHYVGLGTHD